MTINLYFSMDRMSCSCSSSKSSGSQRSISSSESYSLSSKRTRTIVDMSFCQDDVDYGTLSKNLRAKLGRYKNAFGKIQSRLEELDRERRRLEMIARNINPERSFKLSLTQLSAFGFEDIEVGE